MGGASLFNSVRNNCKADPLNLCKFTKYAKGEMMKIIALVVLCIVGYTISFHEAKAENIAKALPSICKNYSITGPDEASDTFSGNQKAWEEIDSYYKSHQGRKLALFLDGTGNSKTDSSNVRVLYRLALAQACQGTPVVPYYDKGVGAKWFDSIPGGAVGQGASLNIRQAYRFLVHTYNPGDEIYLIGFSRGAFTARSLNGFIEFAGLLDRNTVKKSWADWLPDWLGSSDMHFIVKNVFDRYHRYHDGTESFENNLREDIQLYEAEKYPNLAFRKIKVKAIGVFDTVPALGVEADEDPDNHRLDLYAEYGFHALSLDEQRNKFRLLRFDELHAQADQKLFEVWFPGGHANVGGGYSKNPGCNTDNKELPNYNDGLEATSLNWMISKFDNFEIFLHTMPFPQCAGGALHDEFFDSASLYKEFGIYRRKPLKGDTIHKSVLLRTEIGQLEKPHKHREPNNIYKPVNLKYPIPSYYAIESADTPMDNLAAGHNSPATAH